MALRALALLAAAGALACLWSGVAMLLGSASQSAGMSCKAFCGLGLLAEAIGLADDSRTVTGGLLVSLGAGVSYLAIKLWRG